MLEYSWYWSRWKTSSSSFSYWKLWLFDHLLAVNKMQSFWYSYLLKFCPRRFDKFAFVPSIGNSGCLLVIWNNTMFIGTVIQSHMWALVISFKSTQSPDTWTLANIYGPCTGEPRSDFISWLYDLHIDDNDDLVLLGDFNFIRSMDNRNHPGVMYLTCSFLMISYMHSNWLKFRCVVPHLPGVICRKIHSSSSYIGFSPQITGLQAIQIRRCNLLLALYLTTYHAYFLFNPISQEPNGSALRIFGSLILDLRMW